VALAAAAVVMLATCYGTYRHRSICRAKRQPAQQPVG
jgi:sortase (surface protein transpeptidase)